MLCVSVLWSSLLLSSVTLNGCTGFPWILRDIGSRSTWILKSEDTQVRYVKWHSICLEAMHILPYTFSSLDYLQSSQVVLVLKNPPANAGDCTFHPWVWKLPWCGQWQPTSLFLPGKSHGQKNLAGYSPWGFRELDMTGHAHTHTHTHTQITCNICNI